MVFKIRSFILLSCLILLSNMELKAQKGDFLIMPSIGLTTPILDDGLGVHLGVNPYYSINNWLSIEGQISYSYVNGSAFISGKSEAYHTINTLAGGRFYVIPIEKPVRIYANTLLGFSYFSEVSSDNVADNYSDLGFSLGAFAEFQRKFTFGLSFESTQNWVLKVGYNF